MGNQVVALLLAIIGFLGTIVICGLPMWKVTAFVGANIITAQVFWEGLWMNCVVQSTGHSQCKAYDSLLALPQDLQASRALVCVSIAVSAAAIGLTVTGARCTNFLRHDGHRKTSVGIAAGVTFIVAGVLVLVPVCWTANTVVQDFYNPVLVDAQRREIGASLYIGWAASVLLVLGGGLLISSSGAQEPHKRSASTLRYVAVRMSNGSGTAASGPRAPVSPPRQQVSAKPPWADGSVRSEGSKAPSTKSQLKPDDAANSSSLESVKTEGSKDASSNPAKTYL
ncbi:unnamed protein product [Lota lota]